ncbi:hypothetical protein BGX24_005525, partial [Mortierella sp. AD032]
MDNNLLTLFCYDNAFEVEVASTKTVSTLKNLIVDENQAPAFRDVAAKDLILWCVSIPDNKQGTAITIGALDDKTELNNPRTRLSKLFPESPEDNTYILVRRPPPARSPPVSDYISQKRPTADELDLPANKKIRITEGWRRYTASDGK